MFELEPERITESGDEPRATTARAPGKSTLTSRLGASPTSIAHAVAERLRADEAEDTGAGTDRSGTAGAMAFLARGQGRPLDEGTRAFAERGFGHDFGDVRIHTGADAAASAADLGARAYALGNDVVFGSGEYQPDNDAGRWLLAHELSHVVQQGGEAAAPRCKTYALGDDADIFEGTADAAATRVMAGETGVGAALPRGAAAIRRFTGTFPWGGSNLWFGAPNRYRINGSVFGGGGAAEITGNTATLQVNAGSSGAVTLILSGDYVGIAGGSAITRNIAQGNFQLTQSFPYRCSPEGALTVDTAAIVPGSATNDPRHLNPFGIAESEIGMAFTGNSDGSSFLLQTITFTSGGSGVSVGIGPLSVNSAGGTTNTHSVGIRINLVVVGARAATPAPAAPATAATATATATATVPVPVRVAPPPQHAIYFRDEGQTEGDEGALVAWASSLPREAQDAIRDRRLSVTVIGYASTTGDDHTNMERYSRLRARWVQRVLAATLAVDASAVHVGYKGEYTAPAEERGAPRGVANPAARRVEITFAETAPTTAASTTASATATTGDGR